MLVEKSIIMEKPLLGKTLLIKEKSLPLEKPFLMKNFPAQGRTFAYGKIFACGKLP